MAMQLGPGDGTPGDDAEPILEINTTPLIDVMLVLLVMLIITIPIQLHSADLNLPQSRPPGRRKSAKRTARRWSMCPPASS